MNDLDQLRRELVAERGLPEEAAAFLTAPTITGLEAQADELVALAAATSPEPEPEPLEGVFGREPAEKARQQRELLAVLRDRREQPRDPSPGRWTTGPVSFDGGARQPLAVTESHDQWLLRVLASRAADAGARL